jgi:creatinine amidohydrolase
MPTMKSTPLRFELLTHTELNALPRDRTVLSLPVSPLEEHAPHLPLGTDALVAEESARDFARRMQSHFPDWYFVQLPAFFAGASTQVYLGSIENSPELIREYVQQICRKLSEDGFRKIAIFSAHGGPKHVRALTEEAQVLDEQLGPGRIRFMNDRLIPNWLPPSKSEEFAAFMKRRGVPLSDEEKKALLTDSHAGLVETALLLALKPEWVRAGYRDLLPAIVSDPSQVGPTTGATAGEGLGHIGTPHLARPELGWGLWEYFYEQMMPNWQSWISS